jgi:hypothetical protein
MTTQQHPITPPSQELVRKWIEDWAGGQMKGPVTTDQLEIASCAAQWGADQELAACCEWLETALVGAKPLTTELRAARRPKPPSLKEQALEALEDANLDSAHYNTILRALEQLDD